MQELEVTLIIPDRFVEVYDGDVFEVFLTETAAFITSRPVFDVSELKAHVEAVLGGEFATREFNTLLRRAIPVLEFRLAEAGTPGEFIAQNDKHDSEKTNLFAFVPDCFPTPEARGENLANRVRAELSEMFRGHKCVSRADLVFYLAAVQGIEVPDEAVSVIRLLLEDKFIKAVYQGGAQYFALGDGPPLVSLVKPETSDTTAELQAADEAELATEESAVVAVGGVARLVSLRRPVSLVKRRKPEPDVAPEPLPAGDTYLPQPIGYVVASETTEEDGVEAEPFELPPLKEGDPPDETSDVATLLSNLEVAVDDEAADEIVDDAHDTGTEAVAAAGEPTEPLSTEPPPASSLEVVSVPEVTTDPEFTQTELNIAVAVIMALNSREAIEDGRLVPGVINRVNHRRIGNAFDPRTIAGVMKRLLRRGYLHRDDSGRQPVVRLSVAAFQHVVVGDKGIQALARELEVPKELRSNDPPPQPARLRR